MVVHAYNSSIWEVETGGLGVWSQLTLHSRTLSQNKTTKKKVKQKIQMIETSQGTFARDGKGSLIYITLDNLWIIQR
jgi:hypothetical protein